MSDQLTRRGVLRVVRQVVLILVAFAITGAVAGLVWEWLWTAPTGTVAKHQWFQDETGLRQDFSGTGLYVLVAVVAGLLVGVLVTVAFDRAELVTLGCVVVGSLLAGWVMLKVGLALGPDDPQRLAMTVKDGTSLPGVLMVSGRSPFVAFSTGSLVGLAIVFLGLARRLPRT